jgi:hypothetical protein
VTVDLLEAAAAALGDLRGQVVFLCGATVGLWITDPAARAPRVTYDVDVVAEVKDARRIRAVPGELAPAWLRRGRGERDHRPLPPPRCGLDLRRLAARCSPRWTGRRLAQAGRRGRRGADPLVRRRAAGRPTGVVGGHQARGIRRPRERRLPVESRLTSSCSSTAARSLPASWMLCLMVSHGRRQRRGRPVP